MSEEPSIRDQLRDLVRSGMYAEDAVEKVLASCGKRPLAAYAWPFVLREARIFERQRVRHAENAAFAPAGSGAGAGAERLADARLRLPRVEFKLPTGERVAWGQASRDQHEARITWLRTHIGSLEVDLERHERAVKLLIDRDVDRLDDVPGWVDMLGLDSDMPGAGQ